MALCLFSALPIAQAQNPLDVTPADNQPANPLDANPAPAQAKPLVVPDYIKPGARFTYEGGAGGTGGAGAGLIVYDVLAVTDSAVILETISYTKFGMSGNIARSGSSVSLIRADDVFGKTLGALWLDKQSLAALESHPDYQVVREKWPIAGRTYDAIVFVRTKPGETSRHAYDAGTGLLLATQSAIADQATNVRSSTTSEFRGHRLREMPWAGGEPAEWTKTVRKLRYDGMQSIIDTMNLNVPGVPIAITVDVKERGNDWASLAVQLQYQGQPPAPKIDVATTARVGSIWLSPVKLNGLRQGALDEDPTTGGVLRYMIEDTPAGRMGVFVESNAGNVYEMLWAYRLDDGSLAYSRSLNNEMRTRIETQYAGRE